MKNYLIQLLEYEHWANRSVIDALEMVESPPARAVQLMGHILSSQQVWMGRFTGEHAYVAIWEEIPVVWMTETAERNYNRLRTYVEHQPEDAHLKPIAYTNTRGQAFTSTLQEILTHLSHHAAYHRGQVIQLIRPLVQEVPATDYIVWARRDQVS
ncbi:hypothetical protein GCM10023187_35440 [Nibrella viscosa]|uniref:Damage-inducible protein DinB n=1 Tax=Nibrella viscosa TaxID=1084524 RepID=A0ABP8KMZ3_9BACT